MLKSARVVAKTVVVKLQEITGLYVLTKNSRDAILEAMPTLARHFMIAETIPSPSGTIPEESKSYLRYDHPELADLRRRYAGHPAADHVIWGSKEMEKNVDLRYFRADNLYVFQSRRYSNIDLYAHAAYTKMEDKIGLWDRLHEDDHFGAEVFDFHGKSVSRDLLDAITEINFLDREIGVVSRQEPFTILDIGAGYGRLAHRLGSVMPKDGHYFCTDAVPESTFISKHYLQHRKLGPAVQVLPLDQFSAFKPARLDLALNINSFPECRLSVITWWLDRVRELGAAYLFIEVNTKFGLTSLEADGSRKNFLPAINDTGYRLVKKESKFCRSAFLSESGVYPSDYYLFKKN